jgi:putative SOS response-associated peptidase YedK
MVKYHERMPVILKESDYGLWLDSHAVPPTEWDRITTAFGAEPMKARPVSTRVNRADWDGPQCIEETTVTLTAPEPKKELKRKARPSPPPPGKGLFDP